MIPKKPKYIYIYLFKYNSNFTMVYDTYMNKTKVIFFNNSDFTMVYDT